MGRPLDPVLDRGGQRGRAGLGHSTPTLMDLDPQQRAAASGQLGLSANPCNSPHASYRWSINLSCTYTRSRPALAAEPPPDDTPMLPAMPLLVPPDFPDTAVSSAMCLWAEDVDVPVDIARQAILYVHANLASELSQHPSTDCTCLSKPLQALMVTAIRAVTGDASFHLLYGSDARSDSSGAAPATDSTVADSPSMPTTSATATTAAPRR